MSKRSDEQKRAFHRALEDGTKDAITINVLAITEGRIEKTPVQCQQAKINQASIDPTEIQEATIGPVVPTENLWIESDYTQLLNSIVDQLQPLFGDPLDFVVYLYCYRASWGYHKNLFDTHSSVPKIATHCGISKAKVSKAIANLIEKGYLRRYKTDHKRGTQYLVFLPPNATYLVGAYHKGDYHKDTSRPPGGRQSPTTEATLDHSLNKVLKKVKDTPLTPQRGELPKLKIETGRRLPRNATPWEPWPAIVDRIQSTLEPKHSHLLDGVEAVLGRSGILFIVGSRFKVERLTDALRSALAGELIEYGVHTIKVVA